MTNPEYPAGRLAGYIIEQAERLHAKLLQHADRRRMVGPDQAKYLG